MANIIIYLKPKLDIQGLGVIIIASNLSMESKTLT